MVSGVILITGISAHALIDLGATHSFASMTYVRRLGRPLEKSPDMFSTTLSSGEILYSDHWLKAIPVHIDGRELYVDLLVLKYKIMT